MLLELDVVVFLKSTDSLEHVAQRVFGVLGSPYHQAEDDGSGFITFEAEGMGFHALLYANSGDTQDPEFETFPFGLELTSRFWDAELDTVDLEGPLSEYFARLLAFELDVETGTEILIETTEESEIFDIRTFRRNPQYRLDQSPTTPKVFVVENRQVEQPFGEDEDWENDQGDEFADEDELVEDLEREDR